MVKRSIVVDQLSKKNLGRIKYGLLFLFISGSITGITSIYLSHNQEKTVASKQKQVANIIDTKNIEKEEIPTHYFLEEDHDPAIAVMEQFDYFSSKTEGTELPLQQLEHEVAQLAVAFAKEKKKTEVTTLETSKERADSKQAPVYEAPPVSAEKEKNRESDQTTWQKPQISLASTYMIIEQYSKFEPTDYFEILTGNDAFPTVKHNFIDTSKLGEQKFTIRVTDSAGMFTDATIYFFVNSLPKINLKQSTMYQQIGVPVDLLAGVSAMDQEDGDLTAKIEVETNLDINKEGSYEVLYSVNDRHGAQAKTKAFIKIENEAPVIHIPEWIDHQINQELNIFDYVKAWDREDGDISLTKTNILETNFDSNKEGKYFFRIGNVQDRYGKYAEERRLLVQVTNEAPKIIQADLQVNVFSALKKEDYFAQLVVSDREDPLERLNIEIDEAAWNRIDTSKLRKYLLPLKVTDTNGKTTSGYGKITVINEPPRFIGIADKVLAIGEAFDPLAGIEVYDKEETLSLTDVEVTENVDVNKPGTYTVSLSISDSFERVHASYQVTIMNQPAIEKEKE
ncbi:immunoglobulin-like domain-containing protein [Enterococcus hirae]|uniref:immunoglobulin-like domain-containing protein n=1 Tax=Enterococcus hirae TaxID=1354 RepID=UPI001A9570E3|nr:immunoglobulin-like domain-containing protein [Enterococcus hirae]MBO1089777.1 DUF5011 domain-containing protein [Enterococcus hirae]